MAISAFVPRAPFVVAQTLIPSAAYSAPDNTSDFGVDLFNQAEITVIVTSVSGTLNVYIDKLLGDGATYDNIARWPALTAPQNWTLYFMNATASLFNSVSNTLNAQTVSATNFGAKWRARFHVTNTATFGMYGTFWQ